MAGFNSTNKMSSLRRRGAAWLGGAATVALLVAAVLVPAGCGAGRDTSERGVPTTYWAAETTTTAGGMPQEGVSSSEAPPYGDTGSAGGVNLATAQASLDRKIVSNASLQIEVEKGKFQTVFDQALLLADKYGGYIVSSGSSASGEEDSMRSGTIALRVPEQSLAAAISDASKLGTVKERTVESQDVTEEYVDLEARLVNAQSQERALLDLMARAKTVDEVLHVRQVLSATQQEIEQLKGRLNFLDEHSSFSTIAITIYEPGTTAEPLADGWGFVEALKDAARGFVRSLNDLIVFLGEALPVLIILALLAYIIYRIVRGALRRRDARAAAAVGYWASQAGQPVGPESGGQGPGVHGPADPAPQSPESEKPEAPAR